jgi:hypothetical protein
MDVPTYPERSKASYAVTRDRRICGSTTCASRGDMLKKGASNTIQYQFIRQIWFILDRTHTSRLVNKATVLRHGLVQGLAWITQSQQVCFSNDVDSIARADGALAAPFFTYPHKKHG